LQEAEDLKVEESARLSNATGSADFQVSPPSPDPGQQPGFKVVEETPRAANNKIIWTALIVVVAILAAYVLGFFR
jgi:hypothetical protein